MQGFVVAECTDCVGVAADANSKPSVNAIIMESETNTAKIFVQFTERLCSSGLLSARKLYQDSPVPSAGDGLRPLALP